MFSQTIGKTLFVLLFCTISACTSLYQDSLTEKKQQRFGPFTFHYLAKEQKLVNYLGGKCEELEKKIKNDLGLEDLGEIRIHIASSNEDFISALGQTQHAKKWIAALAWPKQGKILLILDGS